MKLTLIRDTKGKATHGTLRVNGAYFCETLEDEDRNLENGGKKIKSQTAIPKGTYEIALTWSPRFKKILPILIDVPQFTGVRIHSGNTIDDTDGCILVGYKRGENWVGESRKAFNDLMDLMEKSEDEGIQITIV